MLREIRVGVLKVVVRLAIVLEKISVVFVLDVELPIKFEVRPLFPGDVDQQLIGRMCDDRSARGRRFGLLGLLRLSQFAP